MNTRTVDPHPWMDAAACAQIGGDAWFPEADEDTTNIKQVCATCPVRAECGEYAITNRITIGIWGGMTNRTRRRIIQKRNKEAA